MPQHKDPWTHVRAKSSTRQRLNKLRRKLRLKSVDELLNILADDSEVARGAK